ncbi:MAG: hypothetical protein EZS28_019025, partial [Streblomastix strix]
METRSVKRENEQKQKRQKEQLSLGRKKCAKSFLQEQKQISKHEAKKAQKPT